MKTKEFEKAIDALNLGIVIDEMKLNHSNVRQVTGHLENEGIIWNEKGEAFSTYFEWRENKVDGDWKSHTNLTHPGKYFRPSKVKIMRPTSPK